jgi:hypothetical protein
MKKLIIGIAVTLMLAGIIVPVAARAEETGILDHVIISPVNPMVRASGNQTFTAVGQDSANQTVQNVTFTWSVINGGGSINATSGLFTANATPGTFSNTILVTAAKGDVVKTANTSVTIAVSGTLDRVLISPENPSINISTNRTFTASGKDVFNDAVNDVALTWSVINGGGSINATSGVFTAGSQTGTFGNTILVTAVKGDTTRTANTSVTVVDPGILDYVTIIPANPTVPVNTSLSFTAIAKDVSNQTVNDAVFSWSVVNGGGSINATSGVFTAGNTTGSFAGTILVTAAKGGITKTANTSVTVVVPGVPDHLAISPINPEIAVNANKTFTATAKDSFNRVIEDVTFTWSVVNGGGSINSTSGVFTAGNVTGRFLNTILVTAVKGSVTLTANTSVTIVAKSPGKGDDSCTPPGWSEGKKNGWHGFQFPPGWFKGFKNGWGGKDINPGWSNKNDSSDERGKQSYSNDDQKGQNGKNNTQDSPKGKENGNKKGK